MKIYSKYALLVLSAFALLSCGDKPRGNAGDIIPAPASYENGEGFFRIRKGVEITCGYGEYSPAAEYLAGILSSLSPEVSEGTGGGISLEYDGSLSDGAYRLAITDKGILLAAGSYGGIISAIASLHQLLAGSLPAENGVKVAAVTIEDSPRFGWRGFMLDCSRHFWTTEEIKGILDLMAFYKLNKFHWHLTDDQGWRIEIKRYPELTGKGAWRDPQTHANDMECLRRAKTEDNDDFLLPEDRLREENETTLYGGFYTQDDIREMVAYAARRGIDVIPEIDMPGHSLQAIENYPELSCFGRPEWGEVFSTPLCPGKASTMEFCRNVWREVFELFPYEYAHLGADEVEKHNWKKCPHCQKRMRDNGLNDEFQLQAWFVSQMRDFFAANGRKLIGWDEILAGGTYPEATITWWRAWVMDAPGQAAEKGYGIIACPTEWLYFNYDQSRITLDKTYGFEPVPASFGEEEKELFLGVQGNLWCEVIPSIERVHYLIFPRFFALSELGWVQPDRKDSQDFNRRVLAHYPVLDRMGVGYRIPDLEGVYDRNVFIDTVFINISCPHKDAVIRWTDDGSFPGPDSPVYEAPMIVTESKNIVFRAFRPDGSSGDMTVAPYVKRPYAPAAELVEVSGEGLYADWYDYRGEKTCLDIDKSKHKGRFKTETVSIPAGVSGNIGLVFSGWLNVPADGIYTFWLNSDDGSTLTVGGERIIDNDGLHSMLEKTGQAALRTGLHPMEVRYFDSNGGGLSMGMVGANGERLPMDKSWFRR